MANTLNDIIAEPVANGQLAGVSAAAILPDGEHWQGTAGEVVAGSGTAMTPDTVVWIASMTKAITGVAVMQLVEQQKILLDAPACDCLPELRDVQVLEGFDAEGSPRLRSPASAPTLRQLLTHISGYAYPMWNAKLAQLEKYYQDGGTPLPTEPLVFDPGTDWAYGTGIDWAGRIVEEVSGQTLGHYLRTHLFDPLGMHSTGFLITEDMRRRLAPVHIRGEDGALTAIDFEIEQNPTHEMGGGGLYGTPSDYLRFCQCLINGGELAGNQILRQETVADIARNHMKDLTMGELATSAPDMTNDLAFYPEVTKNWGLTFMRNEQTTAHGRAPGTLAWAGLANTYFWIDLANRTAGVWATQLFPFNDPQAIANFHSFESAVSAA